MKLRGNIKTARRLRRQMSLPEVLLWQQLRKRPNGLHFRRQHAAGPYVLDFYCAPKSLAIEVDGQAHNFGDRPECDAARDAWLSEQNIQVLRIPALVVLNDLEAALSAIHAVIDAK